MAITFEPNNSVRRSDNSQKDETWCSAVNNRDGVAGAVLQTPLSLMNLFIMTLMIQGNILSIQPGC